VAAVPVRRLSPVALLVALATSALALGLFGVYRYIWTFWLYRGFPPPTLPHLVGRRGHRVPTSPGEVVTIHVPLAGVSTPLPVTVFLPPGYLSHPHARYPSMYFLHGVPGASDQFLDVADVQIAESELVAEHRMPPTVLVMPQGAPSILDDTEWVDGAGRGTAWLTYVGRDVVVAVDRRFRIIDSGRDRAIAGLSEGGYGALNIGLHYPGEFGVIESWSGYTGASRAPRYFNHHPALLAANSPALEVSRERATLLRRHTFFWFYCGVTDEDLGQNERFAAELGALGIPHDFFLRRGGHNWGLWRAFIDQALIAAGDRFSGTRRLGGARWASAPTRLTSTPLWIRP